MHSKRNILVCGDSILDNGPYVGLLGRPLKSHLTEILADWEIDFRAVDGAVCSDVSRDQLHAKSQHPDALVVSVGGNDALGNIYLLEGHEERRFIDFSLTLADIQDAFRSGYKDVLDAAERHANQLLALTIYRPRFHLDGRPTEVQRAAEAVLSIFNDVIQEEARARGHGVLDLRRICVTDEHFANPIEPSDFGGREIAVEIARWLKSLGDSRDD